MGSKERTKGHNYERALVKIFKTLGWLGCATSRYASRKHDDNLIDLVGLPWHIQAKAVKCSVSYSKILEQMKINIKANDLEDLPCMIFHKKDRKESEELVVMSAKDFYKIIVSSE